MFRKLLPVCLGSLLLAGCQTEQPSLRLVNSSEAVYTQGITVASGSTTKVAFFASVGEKCSPGELQPTQRVAVEPRYGRLTMTRAQDFPSFPADSPSFVCNKRRVAGIRTEYTAPRGFVGDDVVGWDTFIGGLLVRTRMTVHVR